MSNEQPLSRLKIAVLIKRFVRTGGAEKYAMEVVRRLAVDHEVHVFAHEWVFDGPEPITFHKIPRVCRKPAWVNQLFFSYFCFVVVEADGNATMISSTPRRSATCLISPIVPTTGMP